MKKIFYGIAITTMLLFLLLYPVNALTASRAGLSLWFHTLVPTLLPFMILSNFLIQADLMKSVIALLAPPLYRLLRLSPAGSYALIIGFFCGYPMGAKVLCDLRNTNQISHLEADYLLSFCNNISPSFIITFLVTEQLKKPALLVPTLSILYGAPLIWGLLQNAGYRKKQRQLPAIRKPSVGSNVKTRLSFTLIDRCIMEGVFTIVKLGGYLMLFAIISGILQMFPIPWLPVKALLTAMIEITNGIPAITAAFSFPLAYLLLILLCSFGGFSAIAQTDSVIKSAHLSLRKYVRSKIIISIIAAILAICFLV